MNVTGRLNVLSGCATGGGAKGNRQRTPEIDCSNFSGFAVGCQSASCLSLKVIRR